MSAPADSRSDGSSPLPPPPSTSPPGAPARDRLQAERRARIVEENVPAGYSNVVHLLVPGAIGLSGIAAALSRLHDVRAVQLLAVPITYLLALAFEWRAHKDLLHRRTPPLGFLYDKHERMHHILYTHEDMAMRSPREWNLVLMPKLAIVLVLVGMAPVYLVVSWLTAPNCALLTLATMLAFFLSYEWLHLSYHLPAGSRIGSLPFIRRLRAWHERHHDPRLMKAWNFNVTVPLFDVVHGTLWTPERAAARARRRQDAQAPVQAVTATAAVTPALALPELLPELYAEEQPET